MSAAGDIITAVLADVAAAISGVTTSAEIISPEDYNTEDFPLAWIYQTDYEPEFFDWGQQNKVWTIHGVVVQEGGTREQMQTKLEAIGTQLATDPTLDASCDRALFASSVVHSHTDSGELYGEFTVRAEKVV